MDELFHKDDPGAATAAGGDDTRGLRVLRLIELLAGAGVPLTLSQLAARMQVPKATMMRTLDNLERHGYVMRTPLGRGYVPGPAATSLALVTLRNNTLIRLCRGILGNLVAATGETCNLAIPDGNSVVYVARVETEALLRLHLQPGVKAPMHCTASGKLFLSRLPLAEQRQMVATLPLTRLTHRTITDPALFAAELAQTAKLGVGIDNEEFVLGMVALAVPICAADNSVVAAVACHASVARKSVRDLLEFRSVFEQAARELRPFLIA
jgi:DNA-binding IclR family transcriptional regulator